MDPKAAVELALREARIPRSSSIYRQLGQNVSLEGCGDASFGRFCSRLRDWFGEAQGRG